MAEQPIVNPTKGCFGGDCNRVGCTVANARYWNRFKHAYYCRECARKIDLEVVDPTTPNCFDWPLRPDKDDRHKLKREMKFKDDHPDKVTKDAI